MLKKIIFGICFLSGFTTGYCQVREDIIYTYNFQEKGKPLLKGQQPDSVLVHRVIKKYNSKNLLVGITENNPGNLTDTISGTIKQEFYYRPDNNLLDSEVKKDGYYYQAEVFCNSHKYIYENGKLATDWEYHYQEIYNKNTFQYRAKPAERLYFPSSLFYVYEYDEKGRVSTIKKYSGEQYSYYKFGVVPLKTIYYTYQGENLISEKEELIKKDKIFNLVEYTYSKDGKIETEAHYKADYGDKGKEKLQKKLVYEYKDGLLASVKTEAADYSYISKEVRVRGQYTFREGPLMGGQYDVNRYRNVTSTYEPGYSYTRIREKKKWVSSNTIYTYDPSGQLVNEKDEDSIIEYYYDSSGRLSLEITRLLVPETNSFAVSTKKIYVYRK